MTIDQDRHELKAGAFAPVPQTEHELIVEALRYSNRVSRAFNDLYALVAKRIENGPSLFVPELDILIRRFSDLSGLHLFIAAADLGLDLPPDLQSDFADD